MGAPAVSRAASVDRPVVLATLVAAFVDDPVLRFLFPEDEAYTQHAGAFFGHLFDRREPKGSVFIVGGGAAAALWEPPATGTEDPPRLVLPDDAQARVAAYDASVHAAMPEQPHWYLGVLGTHPEHAGRRWGHTVMDAGLERAAADGLPAVLETSNEANVGMYERAGWAVVGTVDGPVPTWIMQH